MTHSPPAEPNRRSAAPCSRLWRDALSCLSLANLCFLRVWGEMLSRHYGVTIWLKEVPTPADYSAVSLAVLSMAAVFFAAIRLARRLGPRQFRALQFASFALVLIPLNGLRAVFLASWWHLMASLPIGGFVRWLMVLALFVCAAAALWLAWRWRRWLAQAAGGALLILSPFCLLTFGQASISVFAYPDRPFHEGPPAPRLGGAATVPRVLWVIFDEWDYRLTFVDRSASLAMPAVDRLRAESLHATQALSPTLETAGSLPSLISGQLFVAVRSGSGDGVLLRPIRGGAPVSWRQVPTIFSAVRKTGINAALLGWYLPYCRVLNDELTECDWSPLPEQADSVSSAYSAEVLGGGVVGKMVALTASLFETSAFSPFGQSSAMREKIRACMNFISRSRQEVCDPGLGLVFLHVPVPHPPHPYDRFTGRMDGRNRSNAGYIDSLALLDRMLTVWRADMEGRGIWDHTVVLLSSDHPCRFAPMIDGKYDPRVPFLLHFPGQTSSAEISAPFNTIVSAQLVYAILRHEVSTPAQAAAWLNLHRNDTAAPMQ